MFLCPGCNEKDEVVIEDSDSKAAIVFNPSITYGTLVDADGYSYKTVAIGKQVWMAENLRTTRFNDLIEIPHVTGYLTWQSHSAPAYCYYDNDDDYKPVYGALYNWYAVETGKLCPIGWHVPANAEWDTLFNFTGNNCAQLKESGIKHWKSDSGATNETGFTAVPGGARSESAGFFGINNEVNWHSSTPGDTSILGMHDLPTIVGGDIEWWTGPIKTGCYIRCIKD